MITPKEIEQKTMNPEKRKSAKNDYFAFYIGRPLSYVLTIPFLYTQITPNAVSLLSIIPIIVGFLLIGWGQEKWILVLGWFCFFLWNLLDGVDGNIARYKKQFSPMVSVYDAMSGYIAMVLSLFPRFIMHKTITTLKSEETVSGVKEKNKYGLVKLVALNLTSISGFVQILMLIAVVFDLLDLFTIVYFVLNLVVMLVSLRSIFKGKD